MDSDRLDKLRALRDAGVNPYPYSYSPDIASEEVRVRYDALAGQVRRIAGRIVQKRDFGKLAFCQVQDSAGRLQVMARTDVLGEPGMAFFSSLDMGDIIGVEGEVIKTQKGEISLLAKKVEILSKALRPLPDKFKGLADTELRYRKRHLDLISNPEVKSFFFTRQRIVDTIRGFLNSRGYLEVDTPILQKVYGGAAAKPFVTHHNALDRQLYLRISNELYLKRLIIGGLDRVYEFSKDFRNEDIDSTHNPEFTQVEFYQAYGDYRTYMALTEDLFSQILRALGHGTTFEYQGKHLDFSKFDTVSLYEKIKEKSGVDILDWNRVVLDQSGHKTVSPDRDPSVSPEEHAYRLCQEVGVKPSRRTLAKCVDALFDEFVAKDLVNPTFVIDFPYYVCPLTKRKRDNPRLAERFELFIAGFECGNCYSELTDPIEQRQKLEAQARDLAGGDEESTPVDEDFLEAMEQGMPPTAGMGIGIDRLAMILTNNVSIKEVILFPSMRE